MSDAVLKHCDISAFVRLCSAMVQDQSLMVSLPLVHTWVRLLRLPSPYIAKSVVGSLATLLEVCSERLLRYEALPEDTAHPSVLFLNEDIESAPERHAFLGNYRRYCVAIVEKIVQKHPFEAMGHILEQTLSVLSSVCHAPFEGTRPIQAKILHH